MPQKLFSSIPHLPQPLCIPYPGPYHLGTKSNDCVGVSQSFCTSSIMFFCPCRKKCVFLHSKKHTSYGRKHHHQSWRYALQQRDSQCRLPAAQRQLALSRTLYDTLLRTGLHHRHNPPRRPVGFLSPRIRIQPYIPVVCAGRDNR